jgi:DHA2 family multidrug resistance protein
MLGPVIGGWLTGNYSWRWVFYISLSVQAAIIMPRLFIFAPPYSPCQRRHRLLGIGLLAVGVGARQVLLDKEQEEDWFSSHWMTVLAVIAQSRSLFSCFMKYEAAIRWCTCACSRSARKARESF